jgi:hypothetical protein
MSARERQTDRLLRQARDRESDSISASLAAEGQVLAHDRYDYTPSRLATTLQLTRWQKQGLGLEGWPHLCDILDSDVI